MRMREKSGAQLKVWLAAVLFLHVMVHPVEHALLHVPPATAQCLPASSDADDPGRLQSSDACLACRNASSLIATPLPVVAIGLPATRQTLTPPLGFHLSQPFFSSPSVRAPPLA